MRSRLSLAMVLLGLSCRSQDLAGRWALCLTGNSSSTCGIAIIQPKRDLGTHGRWSAFYPLTYRLDLGAILDSSHALPTRCGSALLTQDGSTTVQLGVRCEAMWEADAGNLSAENLTLVGDSLSGRWYQSCFSGCEAHGFLMMKRTSAH